VGTELDNRPVFHHGNLVRTTCDRKSMCNEQYGFDPRGISICARPTGDRVDRLKYFILGVSIKSRRGFIEEQEMDFGLVGPHERTSEGDTLPLAP